MLLGEPARAAAELFAPLVVPNPLLDYPNRGQERRLAEALRTDSEFSFLCESSDGHCCSLRAHLRDGAVTRISPGRSHGEALGPSGERPRIHPGPRSCPEGLGRAGQLGGADRVTRPLVREGFLAWARAGFPRDPATGALATTFLRRGADRFVALSWQEALDLTAGALLDVVRTFGGDEGRRRLLAQGHDPLLVDATRGAGTQTVKLQAGACGVGLTRSLALHRFAGTLALLDDRLRGTGPAAALGGRTWAARSEGAAPSPGHAMVTGERVAQANLDGLADAPLVLLVGGGWGGDGAGAHGPDARLLAGARLRGTHVVALGSALDPVASRADELLVLRPGTTAALALGVAQVLLAEGLHDTAFVRRFTDLPLLVRYDTGELLRADALAPPGAAGAHVLFDERTKRPVPVARGALGKRAPAAASARLTGELELPLAGGTVLCGPVLSAIRELLDSSYRPEQVERLTWVEAGAIRALARRIAAAKGRALFLVGEEVHELFHADLADRALFLVAALAGGSRVQSLTGPGKAALLEGLGQFVDEDPFAPQRDPTSPVEPRRCSRPEHAALFSGGGPLLLAGATLLTGATRLPTPTKALFCSEPGSILSGEADRAQLLAHRLPGVDLVAVCASDRSPATAVADVIFPLDGPLERKQPDLVLSSTSELLFTAPVTPLPRQADSRSELEVAAGLGEALGRLTGDPRHAASWQFVGELAGRPYLQRILDGSRATRGLRLDLLERRAEAGVPALLRAAEPRGVSPWPTRTGRLELYRGEQELRDCGENLPVHREPIDGTVFEPNVIVAAPHPLLRPRGPASYGVAEASLSGDARQTRHVSRSVEELLASRHPLLGAGHRFVLLRREQPRGAAAPGPGHLALHPADAAELGVADGELVFVDADPGDRSSRPLAGGAPLRGEAGVAEPPGERLLVPVRSSGAPPRGVALLVGPRGARFPGGGAGSCSRTFQNPALLADSLVGRAPWGEELVSGADCWVGPGPTRSEALVRIERAPSVAAGVQLEPAELSARYLLGGFVKLEEP